MMNSDIFLGFTKIGENKKSEMIRKKFRRSPINLDNKNRVLEFLDRFDYILSDCDGVLWLNNQAVPGVPSVMNKLRAMGKKIIFATNNSTKTREEFEQKLTKLGYKCHIDELFPTSFSTAVYLNSIGFHKKVYAVGCSGIRDELHKFGIECSGVGFESTPTDWTPGMADVELDPDVGAVVVGFDNQISFPKLVKACSYVNRPNNLFIASNADESYPSPRNKPEILVPGPGAYVAAIQAVTGKEPIPLGKPFKYFFDIICMEHPDIDPKRAIMIGDRLTTDMVFGRNNGIKTLFVQSGIGTFNDMANFINSTNPDDHLCVPDYYLNSLDDLNKYL